MTFFECCTIKKYPVYKLNFCNPPTRNDEPKSVQLIDCKLSKAGVVAYKMEGSW